MTNKCDKCFKELKYSYEWDTYYCQRCNEWKETPCPEPNCMYCMDRPKKPIFNPNRVNLED